MVYNFLDKKSLGGAIKKESMQNEKLVKNYTYQLLENLRKQKYTHLLQTILRVLVLQICNWQVNLIKEFDFFYALLIFIANMHGLFLLKMKKGITITNDFQNFYLSLIANQVKYG